MLRKNLYLADHFIMFPADYNHAASIRKLLKIMDKKICRDSVQVEIITRNTAHKLSNNLNKCELIIIASELNTLVITFRTKTLVP